MSRRPFHKCFHDDFLMGTVGLTLEEYGAYDRILKLMYSRGGPIPDEPRWIAGQLNITTRKWGAIRAALLSDKKKLIQRGEYLSNPRMERELALEEAELVSAAAYGSMGGKIRAARAKSDREAARRLAEPELPLGPEVAPESAPNEPQPMIYRGDKSEINRAKVKDNSGEREQKPNNINGSGQGPLKLRARDHIPESREEKDSPSLPRATVKARPKARSRIKSKAARAIPKAWEPAPLSESVAAMADAWPPGMQERELEKFRDHAKANGRIAKDWDAAWRNWMRKADDDWKREGQRSGGKRSAWAPSAHG